MNTIEVKQSALAIIHAASTDETRSVLNGINITDTGVCVATDGRMLAVCADPDTCSLMDEQDMNASRQDVKRFKQVLDSSPKKRGEPVAPLEVELDEEERATVKVKDGFGPQLLVANVAKPENTFPNWRSVMTKPEEPFQVLVGFEYLEKMLKLAKAAKCGDGIRLTFSKDRNRPIRFQFDTEDCNEVIGCIMPMRDDSTGIAPQSILEATINEAAAIAKEANQNG